MSYEDHWQDNADKPKNSEAVAEINRGFSNMPYGSVIHFKYLQPNETAEQHYENSVLKLADRISAKGMNVEAIEIKSAYIGVNIEMTFTDGVKTLSAWTIVASGYVQKPHYQRPDNLYDTTHISSRQ